MKIELKLWHVIVFIAILFAGVSYARSRIHTAESAVSVEQLSRDSVTKLLHGAQAILASTSANRDSLKGALASAQDLNATLIAAAKLHLEPTGDSGVSTRTVIADQTRTLSVDTTTVEGTFKATAVAPPFPANLSLSWNWSPAPINATVSLLQLKNGEAVFAVNYLGGSTTITAPFAKVPPPVRTLIPYVDGLYDIPNKTLVIRAGADLRVPFTESWFIVGEAQQKFVSPNGSSLFVGVHKTF